jgi:hypothetical protein
MNVMRHKSGTGNNTNGALSGWERVNKAKVTVTTGNFTGFEYPICATSDTPYFGHACPSIWQIERQLFPKQ